MTDVVVCPRRPYGFDTVTDLTGEPPVSISRPDDVGRVTFAFDGDLDAETVDAVRSRLESRDAADQAARAALRAAAAALPEGDPLRLTICYVLGDE